MDTYQQKALSLLTSSETQRAFDIDAEDPGLRDRYGRTPYGQSVLLARRLVEAGVRFVTVYHSPGIVGWDTHEQNFKLLRESLLPTTEQTLPTLIHDLEARGLLDETLVVWTGEFGRTPKINKNAGRDHWPQCYTLLMAGGGLKRGFVYGASDSAAAYPKDNPCSPDDIAATMFYCMGIDPATELRQPSEPANPRLAWHADHAATGLRSALAAPLAARGRTTSTGIGADAMVARTSEDRRPSAPRKSRPSRA